MARRSTRRSSSGIIAGALPEKPSVYFENGYRQYETNNHIVTDTYSYMRVTGTYMTFSLYMSSRVIEQAPSQEPNIRLDIQEVPIARTMPEQDYAYEASVSPIALVLPFSVGAAAVDGPLPIGDIVGATALAVAAAYDLATRTYVTYTMWNPTTNQTYVGRTSGFGTPESLINSRYSGHHRGNEGFLPPNLDRFIQGYHNKAAIRGREQQMIDFHGGAGSSTCANIIRGVSRFNIAGYYFHTQSTLYFSFKYEYTGYMGPKK